MLSSARSEGDAPLDHRRADGASTDARLRYLSEVVVRLASPLDEALATQAILDATVPALCDAAWLHRPAAASTELAGWRHRRGGEEEAALGRELIRLHDTLVQPRSPVARALDGDLSRPSRPDPATPGVVDVAAPAAPGGSLVLPLVARGEVVATLTCVRHREARPFTPDDVLFAEALVEPGALAIDNARLLSRAASARARAERAEASLGFQARLLDAVGQAVIATDPGGTITYWGRAAEELYGWGREEVVGRQVAEVTPSPAGSQEAADILALMSTGEGWSGEFTVRDKEGRAFPALVTNAPVLAPDGSLAGFIGVSTDLSRRKEAETRLEGANALLRALLAATPAPLVAFDPEGHVLEWNAAAERVFGWRRDEVLGRPFPLVEREERDALVRRLAALRETGEAPWPLARPSVDRLHRNGGTRRLDVSYAPVELPGGGLAGWVAVYRPTGGGDR